MENICSVRPVIVETDGAYTGSPALRSFPVRPFGDFPRFEVGPSQTLLVLSSWPGRLLEIIVSKGREEWYVWQPDPE